VQIAWLLREVAGFRALAIPAYEIESMRPMFREGDFVLAVSQSGETADTIHAVEVASSWGLRIASLVNMPMSTIARLSEFSMANHCGPEICVLSTKSATAQVAFGYLLASSLSRLPDLKKNMNHLSSTLSRTLSAETSRKIKSLALSLKGEQHLFILGRGHFYGTAQVAALNIKEASYVHAEAFAAGELKHGVIALIDQGVPVILFSDRLDPYMVNVAAEVKSRGARVIGIGYEDNELFDHFIALPVLPDPHLAIVNAMIPCQLLAYHLAVQAGLNPDKPRNLAKSVTVQ
jgi:glucosamine--fructose-6-phosphate aminotransferase (isomerizing)